MIMEGHDPPMWLDYMAKFTITCGISGSRPALRVSNVKSHMHHLECLSTMCEATFCTMHTGKP